MSLGENIRAARAARGWSKERLGKELGVSRQTVENWENGTHTPTRKYVPKLISVLGMQKADFNIYGTGGVAPVDPKKRPALVPLIDWSDLRLINAGKLSMASLRKPRLVEANPATAPGAVALQVNDDSMEPTFKSGELIIVDPSSNPQENDCVVARLDSGEHILRHYKERRAGAFDLVAENPDFPTLTVNSAQRADIVGVVVEHHRRLKA
jgi:SOS-response transcriptional repressor LexA